MSGPTLEAPTTKLDFSTSTGKKAVASASLPKRKVGRRGDPRMHSAVRARLADPDMTLLDALLAGGFTFPNMNVPGLSDRSIKDKDGVALCQRKNQLMRRLRSHTVSKDDESPRNSVSTSSLPAAAAQGRSSSLPGASLVVPRGYNSSPTMMGHMHNSSFSSLSAPGAGGYGFSMTDTQQNQSWPIGELPVPTSGGGIGIGIGSNERRNTLPSLEKSMESASMFLASLKAQMQQQQAEGDCPNQQITFSGAGMGSTNCPQVQPQPQSEQGAAMIAPPTLSLGTLQGLQGQQQQHHHHQQQQQQQLPVSDPYAMLRAMQQHNTSPAPQVPSTLFSGDSMLQSGGLMLSSYEPTPLCPSVDLMAVQRNGSNPAAVAVEPTPDLLPSAKQLTDTFLSAQNLTDSFLSGPQPTKEMVGSSSSPSKPASNSNGAAEINRQQEADVTPDKSLQDFIDVFKQTCGEQ